MVKQGKTSILGSRKAYQLNHIDHIHGDIGDSVLENDDLFFPEFGHEMEHIGYLNPSLSSYLVFLKEGDIVYKAGGRAYYLVSVPLNV